jgi:capsular polysaccharide transport system permease protein
LADAPRRKTDVLDAPGSDRSTIIDVEPTRVVEPARGASALTSPVRGALTTFMARLPFLTLPQDAPRTRPFPLGWVTFIACVLVPAMAIIVYFAFIASNQYVAEMRLVVRMGRTAGPSGGLSGMMGQMSGGSGSSSSSSGGSTVPSGGIGGKLGGGMLGSSDGGSSSDDAHIVTSYIQSRAIVDEMMRIVNLREIFQRPEADFYARLSSTATVEDLTDYWRTMVRVALDPLSGIVTVTVRAFRAEDAVELSKHIEKLSEKLVNDISVRARTDTLRRATEEVERAQGVLIASLREMEKYRNREGLIDPPESAKQTIQLLTKVLGDQLDTENQLFIAMKSLSPDSATVRTLKVRAENLRKQVAEIRAQMAGDEGQASNFAGALARYEEVVVQVKLAQTLYTMAENGLERARIAAEAQSVYLTVFVKPGLPEDTVYPRRIQFTLLLCAAFLVAWSIFALIAASVQDHRIR